MVLGLEKTTSLARAATKGWNRRSKPSPVLILKPSRLEGVGVFTMGRIEKGKDISDFLFDISDIRFVGKVVGRRMKWLFKRYAVETKDGFYSPRDFHRMSIGWYLNHSVRPNLVTSDFGNTYRAKKAIKPGTELTIDYRKLDEDISNLP